VILIKISFSTGWMSQATISLHGSVVHRYLRSGEHALSYHEFGSILMQTVRRIGSKTR
jgi:hypothetical protein